MKLFNTFLLIFAVMLFLSHSSYSLEEYAEQTGNDCESCHIDPSGGTELTDIGKGFLLSLEEAAPSSERTQSTEKKIPSKIFKLLIGFLHIFTAFFWFGTILYVHLVLKPAYALKGLPSGEVQVGLVSIVIMAITGMILMYYRVPSWDFLMTTRFGILLSIKISLFLFLVVSALFVVLIIGPRLKKKKKITTVDIGDMSKSQLAQFDGKDGRRSLIGFNNKIYDVTDSKMWKSGNHMMRHNAGEDLTNILSQAPHGAESIEKMPVMGNIIADDTSQKGLSHQHVFYFMAYLNLVVVVGVIFVISMWRWW
jgi:predicted heme/steroid binding protein/uncharacterized membrane protein